MKAARNLDPETVAGFGDEWSTFDQSGLDETELDDLFGQYFAVFPWETLPEDAVGADVGCGTGRWARRVAPRVGSLHLIDPSAEALDVARRNLAGHPNCTFHEAGVGDLPLAPASADFVYSLGVLHHVPDTGAAVRACARLLRPGAPLLLYLYYALDNRPRWYRTLWRTSDIVRSGVARLPHPVKLAITSTIAVLIYWPLARAAGLASRLRLPGARHMPLAFYASRSLYTMRTDAYDRFGTRLERRFARVEIEQMCLSAGLERVRFSEAPPYWCVISFRPD